jgi:quercetin dioxygenase-like cupin family protein
MSAFDRLGELAPQVLTDGVIARVVAGERVTFAVIELDPGAVVPEHAHDNEQLGVLASGSLRFRIGEESRDVEAGGTWAIPPNVPHDVVAGPDGAVAIEVFVPARADWAGLAGRERSAPRWP